MLKPPWLSQLLLGLFLLFDAYLGLIHGASVIGWSGIFTGQISWLALSVEMMAGGLILVRLILNQAKPEWKSLVTISAPILVVSIGFGVLELVLTGLGRSATLNFNLSSIGVSGLYWAALYLSIAIGLTLTYKVQHFANFAQAEMLLVGSYVALTLMWSDRFYPVSDAPKDGILDWELLIWSGLIAFVITGIFGLIIDRLVYRRLRDKLGTAPVMMIASLGVSMVIRALLFMRFSASTYRFIPDRDWRLSTSTFEIPTVRLQLQLGDRVDVPLLDLAASVNPYGFAYSKLALVVGMFGAVVLLLILLHRTRLGRQMRAVADNSDLAASSGIHVARVHGSTAFLSSGIAGLGGVLLAANLPINPELGLSLLLPAFAVIVLGTIGSIPGVIISALIVGMLRAISDPVLIGVGNALDRPTASGFAEVMPFIFLIGILLLAPRGIGSAIQSWNIERVKRRRLAKQNRPPPPIRIIFGALSRLSGMMALATVCLDRVSELKDSATELLIRAMATIWALPACCLVRLSAMAKSAGAGLHTFGSRLPIQPSNRIRIARDTERGSWITFMILFLVLVGIVWLLPSVSNLTKTLQVARIITLVCIFGLACFSLNLHTGVTGMTNFGVIFFVGIGAVTVGLLSAPATMHGYGWNPWMAIIVAVLTSAAVGWLLAYPTARLRMEYFAIVTISLGEMLRISLQAEPLLRAGTATSAIGISNYSRPLEGWWENGPSEMVGGLLGLHVSAPYVVLLAILATVSIIAVWFLLNIVLASPWGRILRSIREDETVTQHHGHNILTHKAASLALGAAVAALAGALWAWLNTIIWPDFMNPVRTTFLIWAAFIVGGRGNNRGMIIGAFLIVIVESAFNVLVVSRGSSSLPLHNVTAYLDAAFSWLVVDVGGVIWSGRSIAEVFPRENVLLSLPHLKLALIGIVIIVGLLAFSKGLLPEVHSRPKRPVDPTTNLGEE
ncbi:MAG: ABC transporter permease [Arenicellales bacterium]|jgi:ABC-type branched-subunit amino acid transport system permease subunit|nr:ABC transporter permease [Arenicellales bacterium]